MKIPITELVTDTDEYKSLNTCYRDIASTAGKISRYSKKIEEFTRNQVKLTRKIAELDMKILKINEIANHNFEIRPLPEGNFRKLAIEVTRQSGMEVLEEFPRERELSKRPRHRSVLSVFQIHRHIWKSAKLSASDQGAKDDDLTAIASMIGPVDSGPSEAFRRLGQLTARRNSFVERLLKSAKLWLNVDASHSLI
jgi:hypothetical protein